MTTVQATTKGRPRFALRQYVMSEIDGNPYIMLRGDLGSAILGTRDGSITEATYVIGQGVGTFTGRVTLLGGILSIGCITFSPEDSATIVAWATHGRG